ncbi:hypothetical protein [Serratia liquefaciens]|uniref:hypothetical protein n=1 Tax=Serratia liquefaciens TaxID=614 RepID=UPI001D38352D|nr:hypothetical protein [Serratia liquefaciens]NLU16186.1 hypothetical protein [Serratia liquefaciens]WBL73257.1 hypothetical protein LQ945_02790 [Serratia liquefaciens]
MIATNWMLFWLCDGVCLQMATVTHLNFSDKQKIRNGAGIRISSEKYDARVRWKTGKDVEKNEAEWCC